MTDKPHGEPVPDTVGKIVSISNGNARPLNRGGLRCSKCGGKVEVAQLPSNPLRSAYRCRRCGSKKPVDDAPPFVVEMGD